MLTPAQEAALGVKLTQWQRDVLAELQRIQAHGKVVLFFPPGLGKTRPTVIKIQGAKTTGQPIDDPDLPRAS